MRAGRAIFCIAKDATHRTTRLDLSQRKKRVAQDDKLQNSAQIEPKGLISTRRSPGLVSSDRKCAVHKGSFVEAKP